MILTRRSILKSVGATAVSITTPLPGFPRKARSARHVLISPAARLLEGDEDLGEFYKELEKLVTAEPPSIAGWFNFSELGAGFVYRWDSDEDTLIVKRPYEHASENNLFHLHWYPSPHWTTPMQFVSDGILKIPVYRRASILRLISNRCIKSKKGFATWGRYIVEWEFSPDLFERRVWLAGETPPAVEEYNYAGEVFSW